MSQAPGDIVTVDAISSRVMIAQRRGGYRFGLDALLLATDLPELREEATALELGAGQGAVALSVAARHPSWRVRAVERQPGLAELLRQNAARNAPLTGEAPVEVLETDLREHRERLDPHQADLVLANPPYYPDGARRPSPNAERADAHHERHGTLADFVAAACYVLRHRGWLKLIAPPWRLGDLYAAITDRDIKLTRLRMIHADATQGAYLFEARLRRGGAPDVVVPPPLFIRGEDGRYTPEVARRVAGAADPVPTPEAIARAREASASDRGGPR